MSVFHCWYIVLKLKTVFFGFWPHYSTWHSQWQSWVSVADDSLVSRQLASFTESASFNNLTQLCIDKTDTSTCFKHASFRKVTPIYPRFFVFVRTETTTHLVLAFSHDTNASHWNRKWAEIRGKFEVSEAKLSTASLVMLTGWSWVHDLHASIEWIWQVLWCA